jgi:hypothetical protein
MGMLFIMMQQVQPAFIMPVMQSQQLCTIAQQSLSPVVQVIVTPSLVISQLHLHIVMLQQLTIMPFIMQQQLQAAPISDMHRFCMVLQATLSSQTQTIFMPLVIFSIVTLQRGTIMVDMGIIGPGMAPPIPGIIVPGIPIVVPIGFIIAVIMSRLPDEKVLPCRRTPGAVTDGESIHPPEDTGDLPAGNHDVGGVFFVPPHFRGGKQSFWDATICCKPLCGCVLWKRTEQ